MRHAIKVKSVTIHLIVIYRTPPFRKNGLQACQFVNEFADMLDQISTLKGNVFIVRDFNIHWDYETNREKREFADLF